LIADKCYDISFYLVSRFIKLLRVQGAFFEGGDPPGYPCSLSAANASLDNFQELSWYDSEMDFLEMFKDPLFVSIPARGGALLHSKDREKVMARNGGGAADGAYFTVNGFANFREGDYHGRTKANVTSFNGNFLDIDLTPDTRRMQAELIYKELCDKGFRPTAVVLTGKGLHVYWLYDYPRPFSERALKEYEELQLAIVNRYKGQGADPQARDAARVLRVPGARYFDKEGRHTCDVELMYMDEKAVYAPSDVARYFGSTYAPTMPEGGPLVGADEFDLGSIINVKAGSRHHDSYSAALSLIQRTKDLASARRMFQAVVSTWEGPLDWPDYWKQFEAAKAKIESETPHAFIGDREMPAVSTVFADKVEMEPVEWLWEGMLARGKAHMLTGEPGLGKSQLTLDIAARLSTGASFPSYTIGGGETREPMGVLILSAEDGAADTMVPRLVAAKADLKNVGFLSSSIIEKAASGKLRSRAISLRDDAEQLLDAISRSHIKIGLVVIDPVSAFLSSAQDSNSNSDARGTLAQLQSVIMDKGIALLIINHTNKNTSAKSAHMRSMGSVGWNAAARATFYVFRDREKEGRRVFSVGKTNLAKEAGHGFFYEIAEEKVRIRGVEHEMPRIEWDRTEFPTKDADEYSGESDSKKETKADECAAELLFFMSGKEEVKASEAVAHMKERGFSQAEIYRTARRAGVIRDYGVWRQD
jgi:RecA-family ATPase